LVHRVLTSINFGKSFISSRDSRVKGLLPKSLLNFFPEQLLLQNLDSPVKPWNDGRENARITFLMDG
jgi:hypothetical protein